MFLVSLTVLAPNDKPKLGSGSATQHHRRPGLRLHLLRWYRPFDGGAYTFDGGNGLRTGSGLSLARMALRVWIRGEYG